jgi:hypothetical protein
VLPASTISDEVGARRAPPLTVTGVGRPITWKVPWSMSQDSSALLPARRTRGTEREGTPGWISHGPAAGRVAAAVGWFSCATVYVTGDRRGPPGRTGWPSRR